LVIGHLSNQAFYFLCILFSNPLHYKVFINTFLDKSNFLEEADLSNLPAGGLDKSDPYTTKNVGNTLLPQKEGFCLLYRIIGLARKC